MGRLGELILSVVISKRSLIIFALLQNNITTIDIIIVVELFNSFNIYDAINTVIPLNNTFNGLVILMKEYNVFIN